MSTVHPDSVVLSTQAGSSSKEEATRKECVERLTQNLLRLEQDFVENPTTLSEEVLSDILAGITQLHAMNPATAKKTPEGFWLKRKATVLLCGISAISSFTAIGNVLANLYHYSQLSRSECVAKLQEAGCPTIDLFPLIFSSAQTVCSIAFAISSHIQRKQFQSERSKNDRDLKKLCPFAEAEKQAAERWKEFFQRFQSFHHTAMRDPRRSTSTHQAFTDQTSDVRALLEQYRALPRSTSISMQLSDKEMASGLLRTFPQGSPIARVLGRISERADRLVTQGSCGGFDSCRTSIAGSSVQGSPRLPHPSRTFPYQDSAGSASQFGSPRLSYPQRVPTHQSMASSAHGSSSYAYQQQFRPPSALQGSGDMGSSSPLPLHARSGPLSQSGSPRLPRYSSKNRHINFDEGGEDAESIEDPDKHSSEDPGEGLPFPHQRTFRAHEDDEHSSGDAGEGLSFPHQKTFKKPSEDDEHSSGDPGEGLPFPPSAYRAFEDAVHEIDFREPAILTPPAQDDHQSHHTLDSLLHGGPSPDEPEDSLEALRADMQAFGHMIGLPNMRDLECLVGLRREEDENQHTLTAKTLSALATLEYLAHLRQHSQEPPDDASWRDLDRYSEQ